MSDENENADNFEDETNENEQDVLSNLRNRINQGEHALQLLQREMRSMQNATQDDETEEGLSATTPDGIEDKIDTFIEFTGAPDRERARRYLIATNGDLEQAANLFLSGTPVELLEPPPSRRQNRGAMRISRLNNAFPPFMMERLGEVESRLSNVRAGQLEEALLAFAGGDLESFFGVARLPSRGGGIAETMDDNEKAKLLVDSLKNGVWDKIPDVGTAILRSLQSAELYLDLGLASIVNNGLVMSVENDDDGVVVRLLQLAECIMRVVCDGHNIALDHCAWWFILPRRAGSRRYAKPSSIEKFLEKIIPNNEPEELQKMWFSENFDPSWRGEHDAEMLACALHRGCTVEILNILIDPVNGCRANVNPDSDRQGLLPSPLIIAGLAQATPVDTSLTREDWSRNMVEVLLDAGALIDDTVLQKLDQMTDAARKLIEEEKDGRRISSIKANRDKSVLRLPDDAVDYWWTQDSHSLFSSLLTCIELTKHDATMHRSMEIINMLMQRLRPEPKHDIDLMIQNHEFAKLLQLLQSVFVADNEDHLSIRLVSNVVRTMLTTTEQHTTRHHDESWNDSDHPTMDLDAKFCLALCRCGITKRLIELSNSQNAAVASVTNDVVNLVKRCIVDRLCLSQDTLDGKRGAVIDVCNRLSRGEDDALILVASMMGQRVRADSIGSGDVPSELNRVAAALSSDDGITAFEFEQCELPSALLSYLLAEDISDHSENITSVQKARMDNLLATMPPPVTGESRNMDEDDEDEEEDDDVSHHDLQSPNASGNIGGDIDEGGGLGSGETSTDLGSLKFGRKNNKKISRKVSSLVKQSSFTLDGSAPVGSTSLETSKKETIQAETADDSVRRSSLYRLIEKLQTILAVHATRNFPVLSHEHVASSGVRALASPIKISLSKDFEFDSSAETYPEIDELIVPVLPLTPLYELQRQLIRSVRITDPRYQRYCERIVGRRILYRLPTVGLPGGSSADTNDSLASPAKLQTPMASPARGLRTLTPGSRRTSSNEKGDKFIQAIVMQYDPYTGAHLLQQIDENNTRPSSNIQLGVRDSWVLLCLQEVQVMERVFEPTSTPKPVIHLVKDEALSASCASDGFSVNDHVAIWWCGSIEVPPGWKTGEITGITHAPGGEAKFDITYDDPELRKYCQTIRAGDKVALLDDPRVESFLAAAQISLSAEVLTQARMSLGTVRYVREDQVRVEGVDQFIFDVKYLRKIIPETDRCSSRVPRRRICRIDETENYDSKHIFSVYLIPDASIFKPGASSVDPDPTDLKLFERVEARYAGKSRYYKGRIARINADGTYDISYDDGDSERGVAPNMICRLGKGRAKVVSYDFRKVFPNHTGRALYDALRREDGVIPSEYNFLTRGFEHQPAFYASFAKTLEEKSMGVFAQFQTRKQGTILFERIQKCGVISRAPRNRVEPTTLNVPSDDDRRMVQACVDIFPNSVIPPPVERDIKASFSNAASRDGDANVGHEPAPPPGYRAQVNMFDVDGVDPLNKSKFETEQASLRWVNATVLGRRKLDGNETFSLIMVLDNGQILWDVPSNRVRVHQRNPRQFPFNTKEREEEDVQTTTQKPSSPTRFQPVELTRQFSAFGQSTAYKKIVVDGDIEEEPEDFEDSFGGDDLILTHSDDDEVMIPPRIEIDFRLTSNASEATDTNDALNEVNNAFPILVHQAAGISIFQCLFQLFSGRAADDSSRWSNEYELKWRLRCLFEDDEEFAANGHFLRDRLPYRTARALAYQVNACKLSVEDFCDQLRRLVPDLEDWAARHRLQDVLDTLSGKPPSKNVNWARITAAYSELCQRPWVAGSWTSPTVSPMKTPTLLKKSTLNLQPLGEAFTDDMKPIQWQASIIDELMDHSNIMDDVKSVLEDCGIDGSVKSIRDTMLLLHLLYQELVPFDEAADPLAAAFGQSLPWRNETVSELLREQLADPLSIATRCFPMWCDLLPHYFSFLFQANIREIHLRCTALGISRAVAWLQDEVTGLKAKKKQLANLTLELHGLFARASTTDHIQVEMLSQRSDKLEDEIKAIEQDHCIGQLLQDLVKVERSELLHDAEILMRKHMDHRSELVIQFHNETGAGDGVTIDFYTSVAGRLQLIEENRKIPMWVCLNTTSGPVREESHTSETQSDAVNDENQYVEERHIATTRGLFPQPLLPLGSARSNLGFSSHVGSKGSPRSSSASPVPNIMESEVDEESKDSDTLVFGSKLPTHISVGAVSQRGTDRNRQVLRRFRFLGRLMGKALLDGWSVPMPLSPEFFMLLQQRQRQSDDTLLPLSSLALIEESFGDTEDSLYSMGMIRKLMELNNEGDKLAIDELLRELDLRFVDPSQGMREFIQLGSEIVSCEVPASPISAKYDELIAPPKGSSAELVEEFAERASKASWPQNKIDEALAEAGHPKMLRWKVIKATQRIRAEIVLQKNSEDRLNELMVAAELIPGGIHRKVTVGNLSEYLQLVVSWWLGHGVERQADAFIDGLRDVLGEQGKDTLLNNFSHSELRRMLCGKDEIQWNGQDPLLGCIVPMGGYTEESRPIRILVETLKSMNMHERSQFLSFATSLPRVPVSGLPQIKVFPPVTERIPGIVVDTIRSSIFHEGDEVMLSDSFSDWNDTENGPLKPGDVGVVTHIASKVCVQGWWYHPLALTRKKLQEETNQTESPKNRATWFAKGDIIVSPRVRAKVGSWDPETRTIEFDSCVPMSARQMFKVGDRIHVHTENVSRLLPSLHVVKVIEHPQAIQMRPYLRPKATTCAKTLYLPKDYDDHHHMLEIFRAAFHDAKLGGMNDQ